MKKISILFLALFLMATVADAGTWIVKPATIIFNDCPTQLTVVRYGLNYITSGVNRGKACVYVTVNAKSSVLFGCVYFKVYAANGSVIFKAKKRVKLFEGTEQNYFHIYRLCMSAEGISPPISVWDATAIDRDTNPLVVIRAGAPHVASMIFRPRRKGGGVCFSPTG